MSASDALRAAQLATTRECDQELAQAVIEAVERLEALGWPYGEQVRDGRGNDVVLWATPFPVDGASFAFDADAAPYWWARRAGADRSGRWFKSHWGEYSPESDRIRDAIRWANSLAR